MGGIAIIDADGALGMYARHLAMEFACERAQETGAYTMAVQNNNDVGRSPTQLVAPLDYGCVGQAFINGRPWLAPWGGTTTVYGPNALSAAIPAKKHYPILIDMSAADMGGLAAAKREYVDGQVEPGRYFDQEGTLTIETLPKESLKMGTRWSSAAGSQLQENGTRGHDGFHRRCFDGDGDRQPWQPEPEWSSAPQPGSR